MFPSAGLGTAATANSRLYSKPTVDDSNPRMLVRLPLEFI